MADHEAASDGREGLIIVIERLLKLGVLFGVIGFISLRAHWNHVGVFSMTWLGLERYLMEFYQFLITSLLTLVTPLLAVLLVLSVPCLRARYANAHRTGAAASWAPSFGVAVVLVALLLVYLFVLVLIMGSLCKQGVGVGVLNRCEQVTDQGMGFLLFYLTISACLFAYVLSRRLAAIDPSQPGVCGYGVTYLRWLSVLATAMLFVWVPIIYGSLLRNSTYKLVQIETAGSPREPVYGLVVLDTPDGVELWQARDGIGHMVVVPRGQIRSITVGRAYDLCMLAAYASDHRGAYPNRQFLDSERIINDPRFQGGGQ